MLASCLRTTLTASTSLYLAVCPPVLMATKRKYYAVAVGHKPGIYESWEDCKRQVDGFKGAKHKSFPSLAEGQKFLQEEGSKRPKKVDRVGSRQLQQCSSSSSVSIKTKASQAALVNNPFRNHALQMSSSVLEMAPEDIEEHVILKKEPVLDHLTEALPLQPPTQRATGSESVMYRLEYDGASKGNPGAAGAGALLRHPDGTVVSEVSVGLGKATNNVAEYRGLIAGMRRALDLGIQRIQVQGDSKLVTMQVDGKWKINNKNLGVLCLEAQELRNNFKDFKIRHVDREYNSAADALANKGVGLAEEAFLSTFSTVKKLMEKL